jgi:hypothetical protein
MNQYLLTLAAVFSTLCVFPDRAAAGSVKGMESNRIIKALDELVDLTDLNKEPPEGTANKGPLELISDRAAARGVELSFHINWEGFKEGTKARQLLAGELPYRIPKTSPRRLPAVALLRILVAQMDDVETTFLIRNGVVEILPAKLAAPTFLLQCKVTGAFERTNLEEVLQALSYQTGATLVLDPRAGELARTHITATFRNDVTLEAALRMVTEMSNLKLVMMPGGLFVTTPSHAIMLHKEGRTVPSH